MSLSDRGRMPKCWPMVATIGFAILGVALAADSGLRSSATYDEVLYLKVAAKWWRNGDQDPITRMGSPSLFWKIQQVVPLWCLDRAGFGEVVDDPERFQAVLLPIVRLSCLPVWVVAMALTTAWARQMYGPRSMVMASALFAMSPNLVAHAPLATMEMPLIACSAGMFFTFWRFLRIRSRRSLGFSAVFMGVAFSCKYTAVLFPPILAILWWADAKGPSRWRRFIKGGVAFLAIAAVTNLVVTGLSFTPLSPNVGKHGTIETSVPGIWQWAARLVLETPVPRELAGFVVQSRIQRQGGTSYLFGERRERGWWSYYPVTLAVKMPLSVWALILARCGLAARRIRTCDLFLPIAIATFLALTILGSTRNYGIRYLLPIAPLVIVWVSAIAEAGRWWRIGSIVGLGALGVSLVTTHPHELSYFPQWIGGHKGGRFVLSDSNLDWGQGLKELARLQRRHPEFADLTLYYFGDTDPAYYGVVGKSHTIDASSFHPTLPPTLEATTRFLAVSTSLQYGPWGPPRYFSVLDSRQPVKTLMDGTITIYETPNSLKHSRVRAISRPQ